MAFDGLGMQSDSEDYPDLEPPTDNVRFHPLSLNTSVIVRRQSGHL